MPACVNLVTYPLSAAQMEIWLAQQINPDSPVYNICQFTEIHGAVDPTLFEAALRQVVEETESLRLQFIKSGDSLQQYVGSLDWSLSLIDVSAEIDPQVAAEAWMRADYEQPTDLLNGRLFGYALLKVASDRFFWYQRYHHIVMDGTGGLLIAQRMAQVYSAQVKGSAANACPFGPVSMLLESDTRYRAAAQFTRDRAYWLERCADWAEPVTLANRQALVLHHRLRQTTYLSSQSVRTLASDANRLAQFMTAVMAAYLYRWTGTQNVVLGFPVTARFGEDRRNPGTVANVVPIRLTVQPDMSLLSLMEQTAQEIQRGFRHQRYRCEELRRELKLTQSQPLFGPMINLMPFDYDLSFGEYASTTHNLSNGPIEDLMIAVYMRSDNSPLRIDFDANPALYTADELTAHQRRFLKFLDALATEPTQPIGGIDLLDAVERRQLLVEWNATACDYPAHQCIHQLFEEQVERTPEATALVYEDQILSYAELNVRANHLAHRLIELGVEPDARVAICVARSPAMIIGLLAILKAGGAYVPLDPAYPSERLTHILADATPILLLADEAGRVALGEAAVGSLTVLDPNRLPESAVTNPHVPGLTSRHLAYVIYTSGSTGMPKGVMVEHRGVVNLVQAQTAYFGVLPSSRVLQFTSFSFDVSVGEIVMALECGAGLYLAPDNIRLDRHKLWDYLARQAITHATLPPALLQGGQDLPCLNTALTLILTGEAPSSTLLRTLICQGTVFNAYGPTETTIWSTAWHCSHELSSEVVPIGRPIANTRLYLLDVHGQPVPLGAVGELYIGGAGVTRGYLNRPELTAERFLPDRFSDDEGARMYKTGDLARYLPDGNLEFLGRNDYQVKIRGFRIETGEIEARLIEHPQVHEAAVLALGEEGDKRLIAYVVAEPDEQLAHTLRSYLTSRLPEYMMPAAFVRLDVLPLTPNGKLDRRALSVPDDEAFARQSYEAPQGDIETALAAIWAELLGLERVSRHDSFFALGGHSLLAMRLMNRVATLGAELPLATLFASPSLSAFAEVVSQHLLQGGDTPPAIRPVSRESTLSLSFAQQRLWFLAQLDGVSETYHIPLAIHLCGPLDWTAWQQALDTVFARHEALRSVFINVEGQPQVQLLAPKSGLPTRRHDLRDALNANEQLEKLSVEEAHAPFDLTQGPLIRARLIQLADEAHVFLLTQHHIVSDGWSLGVLLRELSILYAAYHAGKPDPLPPLAIQYPDYAAWQRQWLSGTRLQTQGAYWHTTLAEAPVLLDLPTDRPRPPQQSFAGAQVPVRFDAQMTRSLRRLSQERGVTLFMTVLAAWGAVLSRLAGQDDVVIGTPIANRNHREIEPLIGFFVNTLALRIDLAGEPNTVELLERVRCSTLAAYAHQDLPFEQVVEIMQPPRKLSHTPLFQVMFAWQNNDVGEWPLLTLEMAPVALNYDIVKFDLELDLRETGDEIVGALRYATALFDPQTIERQVGYLHVMLREMTTDAQRPVATVDLLSAAERRQLLVEWNATVCDYPTHQCIHQLFEAQVARTPEATALVHEDQTLSYAQLNAQANRLAHRLIELGVEPDARVAICVARSPAMVVGLLAILKAGGAYVPLDPAYPSDRLTYILADAAPILLLADGAGRAALGEAAVGSLTVLDPNRLPESAVTNPYVPGLTSRHLAYVIYTSGSTGMPKGVMVEHRGVVNLVQAQTAYFGVRPSSRVLQFTSFSFDVSVGEIVMALGCGAGLYLAPDNIRLDRHKLWDYLARQAITHATLPPALLQGGQDLPCLNTALTLILTGEAPSSTLLRTLICQGTVFNAYGPTETTIWSTVWPCLQDLSSEVVPIGRPIANTRLYLLDVHGQPVPLGAVGELYIGGAGVTRGYLNRPELTAERFLPDRFSDDEEARMYKTGDLARYLPDGNLEFLGRNDYQVKIRGFRIETGEIEARLIEHPQVREAAVLALGEEGDKRLVAYVVAEPDEQLAHTLRSYLTSRLPEYMMPAAFVRLNVLPLTPNGKLDRRALSVPDDEAFARQSYEAPQGEFETALAAIWSELLGVEQVSRHDSFFALGGHSLLAVQIIERLRRLGLGLSVSTLFETPTLSVLAQALEQHREVLVPLNLITPDTTRLTPQLLPLIDLKQAEIDRIVAQTPGGVGNIQDIYALSPLQDGILFHHLLATKGDPYLLAAQLAFPDRALLDRYLEAVQQVVNRHDILRTAFVWEGMSTPAQTVWRQASLSITELSLNTVDGPIIEQLRQCFDPRHYRVDLSQAPLLRFAITQDSDGRWLLHQLLHHLIGDHSTLEVMHAEVQAFIEGRGDSLPAPQPFRNLVVQARLGVSQEAHERFFKEMLTEVDEPTLPFGLAEVHRDGGEVMESHRMLSQDLNDRLRAQAKRLGVSLASLCHLAWAQVLARTSGQQRVVFGTVLFGRMQAGEGADSAMGLFINTLPLRIDLVCGVEGSVRDTHARLAALLEHEYASLALARRCSSVPAGVPLFSALLNYRHNAMSPGGSSAASGMEFLGAQERTNYPLTLSVEDFGSALGLTAQVIQPLNPARVCGYMQQTLESLAEALEFKPYIPVWQLEVLPIEERELLLQTWNATATEYPEQQCIHQLFEEQVERTPEATALVYEDQILSYAELNVCANRLAHRLIELGVKPDARVAICVARSPAMIIGLLAILKAGGAYVPLDPAYPGERLTHILADAAPDIVLADAAGRAALGDVALASRTVLDPTMLPDRLDTNPSVPGLTACHLAYVIYTSGSTGMPKGVMVEHQSLANLYSALQHAVFAHCPSHARVGLNASIVFDASLQSVLSLLNGCTLMPIPQSIRSDGAALRQWLAATNVDVLDCTPLQLEMLLSADLLKHPRALTLLVGGESIAAPTWQGLANAPHLTVYNVYGPTECTVDATLAVLKPTQMLPTIGRPIANTRIYLLDAHGQPVPLGAVGELYIGGAGVARGYLNRPELTVERFVHDPFCDCEDARMYKTGDLACYRPDGNLEYLGRNDDQVKLRGFRIEPGEIEARLVTHPAVREAAVLALGEEGDKRLVAYVVAELDEQLAHTLRSYLTSRLPEYMMPAAFVRLDVLPLTPNGKLDRRALPAPDDEAFARQSYEAPQGDIETALAAIWAELLGLERVSRHDSFFALGGHSLLAMRLMNRVATLGAELPLATLFASPSLLAFAEVVSQHLLQGGDTPPAIRPVSRESVLSLSFAQQRLWFLAQLDGVSETYHIPLAIHLCGPLDWTAWQQALDTVFARHEALRSVFINVEGQPQVQLLAPKSGLPTRRHDLRDALNANEQLEKLSVEEAHAPFDLTQGPLIRARLIQLADEAHVFLLTQHHIVSDGWSLGVLLRELSILYAAYHAGKPDPLPPLAIQYPDYAAWQRQWLSGTRLQTQGAYWHTTLAEAPVLLDLPTDRPRPPQQSFAGAQVPVRFDAQMTRLLRRLSQERGVTLFMTVLAAWGAVLSRLAGQDDVVIGTPIANRNHREIEPLIGFFVNTLALRIDLAGEPNTVELLERVRCSTLAAYAHQDLPFEQVVEIMQPPRKLSHTPLFQVMFAWQNNDVGEWPLLTLEMAPVALNYDIVKFDLELDLRETGDEIVGALRYATALFDPQTIERQVGYLHVMLREMATDAKRPVATVDLLAPVERKRVLETWNATATEYPEQQCIHQLFEAQVERTPEATALVYEDQILSYAELNVRANRLAHRLIEQGVKPDARVAICVARSPAMIIGLLAILKAGGAYVPLDPAYPSERLTYILADATPILLLADGAGRAALGEAAVGSLTVLDPNRLPELAVTNPHVPGLTSRHLAYVIYTSGSTGTPKGVQSEHRALINRLVWMQQAYGLTTADRVLQKTSFSFDVSVWEFFWTLLNGATLVVAAPDVHRDTAALMALVIRQRITTVHFVPSMLGTFLHNKGVQHCTSVKRLICSGEALSGASVRLCQTLLPGARLYNLYGPTEAAIDVTAWNCPSDYAEDTVPIGRPIANTRIYLLDACGQPVPLGAVGELYVGGAGVARGYLNRPELTAERFLPDRFSDDEGARIYKTGDLARYLPDGNLEFLGRNDHQVKIRGFRIETGEIEARLIEHPQVREAAVLALGEEGDKRLVAHVVAEPDEQLAHTLRSHLTSRLPEYMMPAAFVRLDVLPLTPNGKLDRRALPVPDDEAFARQSYEAPQGDIETALAAIWSELLGVEQVSRHDSFFALGGHSLLAMRLMNRVATLGAELPLATLFASPSLLAFAEVVSQHLLQGGDTPPAIRPVSRESVLSLSFAQQRLWFLAQLDGVSETYHIPLAIHLCGPLDWTAWQQALDTVFARHEALRSVFINVEGQPQVQLLAPKSGLPTRRHDLRDALNANEQLEKLSVEEAHAPFDLTQGPLIRARLIQLADEKHVFLLTQHHIVSDGWSLGVLLRELSILYAAYHAGKPDPLPPLALQYPDYAAWQRQWLSGTRLQTQGAYWHTTLAEAPVLLDLPTDRPRPPQQSFAGAQVPVRFDAQMTRSLRRLSQERGVTLFMTVLAAWGAVLSRLAGQDDVVIGTPIANRNHREIEPLIGFFVNTLALRIDLAGEPNTVELLERVRCSTLAAYAHQDLPFEQVVEIMQPPRKLSHTPLFQVMFAWQNNDVGEWPLLTLEMAPVALNYDIVKFDLELDLRETGDEIVGALRYATALFDPQTIERQVGYLHVMLREMTTDAQRAVATVDLLSAAERRQLLVEWNATVCDYPTHQCIHQLFEEQVERTPEATALVHEDQTLNYAQLNAQANHLAHRLIELGVEPDARVAICVARSPAMIIGLLAILKAGGAYVPLDPAYPSERLAQVLADAAPDIVLADAAGRAALGDVALVSRTILDPTVLPDRLDTNPSVPGLTARHLAYVIYTSGSTGMPKGVMVEHAQVVRLFDATQSWYHFDQHDIWCLFHSFAFDFSVWEIWGALRHGSKLIIVPHQIARSPQDFHRLVCEQGVTVLNQTPSAFKTFIASQAQNALRDQLRYVILGGEALEPSILQTWYATRAEQAPQLVNMYGITETTVHVTYRPLRSQDSAQIGSPIGVRIPDLKVYLLDAYGQPVPLGAVGELYVGGAGVARGYLNRPELTAERFVRDPFSDQDDARMYKTGDLARYQPDGNLEFVGRNDHQVKLRGFRIELGEIEACLAQHPQVRDAVVLVAGDGDDKRLVAYVVAPADAALASTLRVHVATCLPEYMVPAAFVQLDALPLTPNSKLDRRALPALDADAFAHQSYEAPQGEFETALAAIWSELLGVEQVSRHDSFFALGGHSLLAVQMIERLRRLGLGLSVNTLFETPTLSVLAQALGQHREVLVPLNLITPDTTRLTPQLLPLIDLKQAEIDRIVAQTPGGVGNIQDIYALSPLQDGILFHHLLATKGDPYLLAAQLAFSDRALLDRYLEAVQQVVNRHDILRTAFVWEGMSTLAQTVWRRASLSITELSLNTVDGPIIEQLRQCFDPRHYRVDLNQAPLLRFAITQDSDGRWLLHQLLHHLIGDHSTLEVMHAEVQAFIEGRGDSLPAPQPFRNLVVQARLGVSQEAHERFFTDMLIEIEAPTLPFGLAEVHRDGAQVIESHHMLPQHLNDRLRAQAKRVGVSLASLCHLAWAQVLARASGQQRVVFGTVLFGRMQAGVGADRAMGLFINTLPLRVDLDDTGVKDSVRDTHARLAALLEHEHASLALAQRCSSVPVGTPLFSALLNYRHNAMPSGKSTTASGIEFLGGQERTNYPFTLSVEDFGAALGLTAQVVQPFDPAHVCSYMQQALQSLAEALERKPDTPVWQLEVLPIEERERLLETWNATATPYPEHLCIHQLFEEQVERTPEACALVYEDQMLSYAELNVRANRLAHRLIELGVEPDARVGICVARSPAMIIGLLAILKAGGAYVPLDPAYPSERLTYILADATPILLLADGAGRAALGEAAVGSLTVLDPNRLPESAVTNPHVPGLTSHHLAYVSYTSGSTGMPKGVMVEHRGVVNFAQAQQVYLGIDPSSRVLQFTSISFDVSVSEIVALGYGASLYLPPDNIRLDRHKLWDYLARQEITHATLPPALLQDGKDLPSISTPLTLVLGGEAPSSTLLRTLICQGTVFNAYGPTETTIWSTTWPCLQDLSSEVVPIGRPIANTRLYLLDVRGQPVPLGAVGELYIGGAGVTRGYLNRPELTAERFLPDRFSDDEEARMYKTGDLARYLPDGNLEFLGRNDHQVKIRGFRIETGEIEARLIEHPSVREAAVLALGEEGDKRLVAYVVAEPDEQLAHTLRSYLTSRLPEYMMPAAFVRLDVLPLTPNGKLDRRALPVPDDEAFARQSYEAPQGELETALAAIWAELLGLERVSRHDSFFALGGHSLLAVQMINLIRTTLGVEVTLSTLFKVPILAGLAQCLFKLDITEDDSFDVLLPLKPTGTRSPLFCVHPAPGLSWSYISLSKHLDADQPIYGLQARGLNGASPLAETIEAMASDYLRQIRHIQPNGPYHLLGWSFGGNVAHSMATQLEQEGEKVAMLALLDSYPDHARRDDEPEMAQDDAYIKLLARYGDESMPNAGEYLWEKTRDVTKNNAHLLRSFAPLIFCGDVLFFRATIEINEAIPCSSPDLWQPYVLGEIEAYDIHCEHIDMDKPAPIAEIGRILADKLDKLQMGQSPQSEEEPLVR